jgi:hypothetical protein
MPKSPRARLRCQSMCVVAKLGLRHGPSSPRRFPGEVVRDFATELMLLAVPLVSPRPSRRGATRRRALRQRDVSWHGAAGEPSFVPRHVVTIPPPAASILPLRPRRLPERVTVASVLPRLAKSAAFASPRARACHRGLLRHGLSRRALAALRRLHGRCRRQVCR